jgi:hypothetical protein
VKKKEVARESGMSLSKYEKDADRRKVWVLREAWCEADLVGWWLGYCNIS